MEQRTIVLRMDEYEKIIDKLAELEAIRRAQANEVQRLIDALIDAETEGRSIDEKGR